MPALRENFSGGHNWSNWADLCFFVGFGRLAASLAHGDELPEAVPESREHCAMGRKKKFRCVREKTTWAPRPISICSMWQHKQCPYDAYKVLRDEAPVYKQPATESMSSPAYERRRPRSLDPVAFPSSPKKICCVNKTGSSERQQVVQQRSREWLACPNRQLIETAMNPNHKQDAGDCSTRHLNPARSRPWTPLVGDLGFMNWKSTALSMTPVQLVSQFAVPLALYIIGEQMGAPRGGIMWKNQALDHAFFHRYR